MKKTVFTMLFALGLMAASNADCQADVDSDLEAKKVVSKVLEVDGIHATAEEFNIGRGYLASRIYIDSTEIFVTGLVEDNIDKVETELVRNYNASKEVIIEDSNLIDAEKIKETYNNEYMCWAATSANLLTYSGWAQKAGFENEDKLCLDYESHFKNVGLDAGTSMSWFFNGSTGFSMSDTSKILRDYPESGAYIRTVNSKDILAQYDLYGENAYKAMPYLKLHLKEGDGVYIRKTQSSGNNYMGGHLMNCWGYIVDNSYSEDSKAHYKALITGDSVSTMRYQTKAEAPNQYNIYHLEGYKGDTYEGFLDGFKMTDYSQYTDYFTNFGAIASVDGCTELTVETEGCGNTAKTIDISSHFLGSSFDSLDMPSPLRLSTVPSDENISIVFTLINYSDLIFDGTIKYSVDILDSEEKNVFHYDSEFNGKINNSNSFVFQNIDTGKTFSPGNYEVYLTINPNKDFEEAFYYNNVKKYSFKVLDNPFQDLAVSVDLTENDANVATANLHFTGIPEEYKDKKFHFYLCASYYINGVWSPYEYINHYSSGSITDDTLDITKKGTAVKFKFFVSCSENDPFVSIKSDECAYSILPVNKPADNSGNNTSSNNISGTNTSNSNNTTNVLTNGQGNSATANNSDSSASISKSKVKISSLKNSKKKAFVLKFKKISGAKKYDVSYSLNKKFKKAVTKTTAKTTFTVKKLKKGKTYYVRVRAVNGATKGSWSKIVKVKIKK